MTGPARAAAEIFIRLKPRSSSSEITAESGGEWVVTVTAPPVNHSANRALIALLAEVLDVAPSRISLTHGATSSRKRLRIEGISPEAAEARLRAAMLGRGKKKTG